MTIKQNITIPEQNTIIDRPPEVDINLSGQAQASIPEPSVTERQNVIDILKNKTPNSDDGTGTGTNYYYDIINAASQEKPEYKPTGKDGINGDTSAGSVAAQNTQYSWDKQGTDQAQNQYQQDLLAAKQDALANRQTIEQNALQYQQQADLMKYANNQNAEKVGWTGGYVLDQNRQMEYLKASIQAQMYGAMELQKYGYDSALAAARLSYDLNQQQFAHQYYQDAVNVAISEAQITGTYFSAETRDMMSQLSAAEQELGELKDKSSEEIDEAIRNGTLFLSPEQERALEVKRNIEAWYKTNNVSTTGIKTLAAWESEQSMIQQWADAQWDKYQAALGTANNKISSDSNVFIKLDDEGNPIYNGLEVETLNFRTMTPEDIIAYVNSTNQEGKEQVYSYVDNSIEQDILNYISSAKTITNEDGSKTVIIDKEALAKLLKDNKNITNLKEIMNGYEYQTKADESTVTVKVNDKGEVTVEVSESKNTSLTGSANKNPEVPDTDYIETMKEELELDDTETALITDIISNPNNKGYKSNVLKVNEGGDKFTNNYGNHGDGNNFSLDYQGTKYRVQTGPQVEYGSVLDVVLESYSQEEGAVAIVNNVIYARDNCCWYVVECRDTFYKPQWKELQKKLGIKENYMDAPSSDYYTSEKQGPRYATLQDRAADSPTYWAGAANSVTGWSVKSATKNKIYVTYKGVDYNITVKGIHSDSDTNDALHTTYDDYNLKNGDIVYYNNKYYIYGGEGGLFHEILLGNEQKTRASEGEKYINALLNS